MPCAIVTGGAGALGTGISRALISNGWRVIIADKIAAYAEQASAALGGAAFKILDVTDLASVRRIFGAIAEEQGGLDALVNCAGGTMALRVPKASLVDSVSEHWDRMIAVNLFGTFNCCYTAAPYLKRSGRGAIVSIASGAGMQGGPPASRQTGAAVYSATKAGVIAFTQALAQELGPQGVRVNAVAPGRNESRDKPLEAMLRMQAAEEAANPGSGRLSPLKRFGAPSDIGNAVAFLLSEQASYITGACLDLTGGIRLH